MNDLRANRWQLPDGVNELLPDDAWRVETLRRQIIDNAYRWGYELVMPPMIEYLDSLLTGTGEMLDLQTFKIIDQHNGRSLGVRADMTPQVARMDAHALRSDLPNRFFYTGSVLRARADGAGSSRTPLQFGAELFGHSGPESDAEIIQLMLDNVMRAGLQLPDLLLDMGHVGVYRALIEDAKLPTALEKQLFQSLLRGSRPEVMALLREQEDVPSIDQLRINIDVLMKLSGNCDDVLLKARQQLGASCASVQSALDNLESVVKNVTVAHPSVRIHVDLAELRGFSYHTGILFTLYDESGGELARGGRYDAIGEAFGQARPATGFSGDLIQLSLAQRPITNPLEAASSGIWVDSDKDAELSQIIRDLRSGGDRVVLALPGSSLNAAACHCDRQLVRRDGHWVVEALQI
ncbi:MAG: ATP phosphoribosyltransferase regulatory subunit [Granulosicoccus sp.]